MWAGHGGEPTYHTPQPTVLATTSCPQCGWGLGIGLEQHLIFSSCGTAGTSEPEGVVRRAGEGAMTTGGYRTYTEMEYESHGRGRFERWGGWGGWGGWVGGAQIPPAGDGDGDAGWP